MATTYSSGETFVIADHENETVSYIALQSPQVDYNTGTAYFAIAEAVMEMGDAEYEYKCAWCWQFEMPKLDEEVIEEFWKYICEGYEKRRNWIHVPGIFGRPTDSDSFTEKIRSNGFEYYASDRELVKTVVNSYKEFHSSIQGIVDLLTEDQLAF